MRIQLILAALAFGLCACSNERSAGQDQQSASGPANKQVSPAAASDLCYQYHSNGDTVNLQGRVSADKLVLGNLEYRLSEKDANHGRVQGFFKQDTLFLEYIFRSEGVESSRELAFLLRNGKLEEGYGDQLEKSGKMVFRSHAALKFGHGIVLSACP